MSAVIPSGKGSKDLQSQRTFVEQLRRELKVQRVKLSQCANELIQYCEQQGNVDPLVSPKAGHDNPFRNSGSKCVLLWGQSTNYWFSCCFLHWIFLLKLNCGKLFTERERAREGLWGRSCMLGWAFMALTLNKKAGRQLSKYMYKQTERSRNCINPHKFKEETVIYLLQRRHHFITNVSTSTCPSIFDSEGLWIT